MGSAQSILRATTPSALGLVVTLLCAACGGGEADIAGTYQLSGTLVPAYAVEASSERPCGIMLDPSAVELRMVVSSEGGWSVTFPDDGCVIGVERSGDVLMAQDESCDIDPGGHLATMAIERQFIQFEFDSTAHTVTANYVDRREREDGQAVRACRLLEAVAIKESE